MGQTPFVRGRSADRSCGDSDDIKFPQLASSARIRPGSADAARRAMGGSPMIVMSPLHPRKGTRGDGSVGPPTPREQELREVCRQVAELAPQKFSTVREAYRFLTPDHNGRVSRSQVCYFFRAYGVERAQADRLFCYFDPSENDDIDGHKFIAYFKQYINPDTTDGDSDCAAPARCPSTPGSRAAALNATATDRLCAKLSNKFHYMLEEVRAKAPQRFSHVREALRIVDVDYDGCITRSEMQHFFRALGIDEMRSDKLYEEMAEGGPGGANYHTFVQVVGPFLELPGVVAATRPPSRPQSARSRPPSAEIRQPSAPRRPASPGAALKHEVLESALSETGNSCLPAVSRGLQKDVLQNPAGRSSSAAKVPASPRTPTSARGARGPSQEGSLLPRGHHSRPVPERRQFETCESSRPPASVCESPRPPASVRRSHAACESPRRPASAHKEMDHLEHQLVLGNFQPHKQADDQVFQPAAPPARRQGHRPVGIQRAAPLAQKVEKNQDRTQVRKLEPELAAATEQARDALMSGGRPVSTPSRRPSSRGRSQRESS